METIDWEYLKDELIECEINDIIFKEKEDADEFEEVYN